MDGIGPFKSLPVSWRSPIMTEILLTGTLSLNSINKQARAVVIGLIALIFDPKTINIFASSFIKHPNPFIKNQLSIIRTGKEPVTKMC